MQVALLANVAWLDEELLTFKALLVGLMDENVGAVKLVPESISPEELGMMGQRLTWRPTRWAWLNHKRLLALAGKLQEMEIDLIHALDGRMWRAARLLAEHLDLPVIYQANSHMDLKLIEPTLSDTTVPRLAFTATTAPLAEAMRPLIGDDEIELTAIAPGVHGVGDRPRQREPGQPLCAIVSGSDRFDAHYHGLLHGLAQYVQQHPQAMFFIDGQGDNQHHLWRAASRIGLAPNISIIPRRLGHRELLLRADLLIHPQPQGKSRTFTLQAMAHGLPVLVVADPWLDYLIDGRTAWVINRPTPDAYFRKLMDITADPVVGRQLGESAQHWVRHERLASDMVARHVGLYRATSGEAIEFPG
ncbi:MAG: glycosyltransferase family 4 protein [Phycisphaeraceae bacterium]|nr:glycosyltransferase family 4 protein [Phycisphaeraceae bacterium]